MAALVIFGILACVAFAAALINSYETNKWSAKNTGLVCVGLVFSVVAAGLYPYANVWQQGMAGKAQMAQAEANRQITVREAQAKLDASQMLADAEVARARGVAAANKIVADGLGGPEGYLRYLFIESLKDARGDGAQVIYVPTEAGLPILEANRLGK